MRIWTTLALLAAVMFGVAYEAREAHAYSCYTSCYAGRCHTLCN